jgi:hypothetical protein
MAHSGVWESRLIIDNVVEMIAPYLKGCICIALPDNDHDCVRAIYGACEARIHQQKRGGYTYEIVSPNALMARGKAGSVCAALERTTSLLLMFEKRSGSTRRAA